MELGVSSILIYFYFSYRFVDFSFLAIFSCSVFFNSIDYITDAVCVYFYIFQ